MIGFRGTRNIIDPKNGMLYQRIRWGENKADEAFWKKIFKAGNEGGGEVIFEWRDDMTLLLGEQKHPLQFQSTTERDQWRQTLQKGPGFRCFARFSSDSVLIGTEVMEPTPIVAAVGGKDAPPPPPDFNTMTDAQLRTYAAEQGITVTQKMKKADLLAAINSKKSEASSQKPE
ncbi:MAG: hypothetical protein FWD61_11635 [Phycisphaerales bacterium]|nr:hypothetical protein [Phycisphaerales bacterium]